ncbi:MAG: TrmB family transcriptional regulator [Thaumarchaeota archaeon]|nr:MAG: TrmB family transcriptional regulator [Nitrososphaerota archaeon]
MTINIEEKLRKALHNLGLTDYEMRAYISLLKAGKLTASELSEIAGVPYSKIYDVLENLEKKGWIRSEGGRPARFHARPPKIALDINRMRIESELKRYEETALAELLPIYQRTGEKEKHDVWILKGETSILSKIRDLILECENELQIAAPWMSEDLLNLLFPPLALIANRGGKIRIMLSGSCDSNLAKKLEEIAEIRFRDQMFGGGAISDSKEAIIILGAEEEKVPTIAIWSDHVALARIAKVYFDYLWKDAKPFKG